jgi:diguanylate cyclase (GGDEF)-like protein
MYTILVVDDSPIELLMTKTLLQRLGFSPEAASNGVDALDLIREKAPNVVICDITMPGMSGLELLKATQSLEQPPIFIMATGLDDAEHAVMSLQHGAYAYLTKPLKEALLREALQDATDRRHQELEARQEREILARTDTLTRLLNKDTFLRNLDDHAASLRGDKAPLALFFVNIDGMRYVNNTYGQFEGDRVLRHVANILRQSVRPSDLVARYGGDVFAIALVGIEACHVEAKAQAITSGVEELKIVLGGREHSLTVTVGVALGCAGTDKELLVSNADLALLLAKEKGRNQIYFYQEADETRRQAFGAQFINLEILKRTLRESRFSMHYQPIVHLEAGVPHHYEALIRLQDETGEMLPPDVFIKVAENFGLATKIDCMVVTACIRKLAELARAGSASGLAINLSGKSVGSSELLELIKRELAATGADPTRIIFEITETAAFHNLELVQRFVRDAKQLGCRFALDDFGVGFSSFYYIKQLDIDYLKIDGSFIRNLRESANDRVFVQAMVEISRVYGMQVIAEWVEDPETMALLAGMGVEYGQGYHFGKPAPECEMRAVHPAPDA